MVQQSGGNRSKKVSNRHQFALDIGLDFLVSKNKKLYQLIYKNFNNWAPAC